MAERTADEQASQTTTATEACGVLPPATHLQRPPRPRDLPAPHHGDPLRPAGLRAQSAAGDLHRLRDHQRLGLLPGHHLPVGVLQPPPLVLPLAVTVGYVIAAVYSFLLNRWLNFQAHGHVVQQGAGYMAGVVSQYVIFILGLSSLLHWFGVNAELARVISACCEGIYL